MATNFIPELDYFFKSYWDTYGEITTYNIATSTHESNITDDIPDDSVLELLFSSSFSSSSYNHLFESVTLTSFSLPIRDRIHFKRGTVYCYKTSETGSEDVLDLEDSLPMLELLFDYRTTQTCDLTTVTYSTLSTKLSKLIYLYLDLMINNEYENINLSTIFSDSDDVLSNLFETYLINEAHKKIKAWAYLVEGDEINLVIRRYRRTITESDVTLGYIVVSDLPYTGTDRFVYKDGDLLESTEYGIVIGESNFIFGWDGFSSSFEEGDVLIIDYYIEYQGE